MAFFQSLGWPGAIAFLGACLVVVVIIVCGTLATIKVEITTGMEHRENERGTP